MRRLLMLFLAIVIVGTAAAETDLSSMSFDELVTLNKKITAEIMNRPEWKEVNVPAGEWKVGEDIPVGSYSISCASYVGTIEILGEEKDGYRKHIAEYMVNKGTPIGKVNLENGWIVKASTDIIFAPPLGLGF